MPTQAENRTVTQEDRELLKHSDPRKRLKGLRALVKIGKKLAWQEREPIVKEIELLASDPQPFILWNLTMGLGEIGHPCALPLLEKLSTHEHANVRFRAALAIALIDEEKGLGVLERISQDEYKIGEHYVVRAFAALALGKLASPKGVPVLSRLAKDPDPAVRWHTAVALGDIGDSSGISALGQLVEDSIPFVRAHTAIALSQIGHPDGRPYLEKLAKDSAPKVAQISSKALDLLERVSQA